MPKRKQSTNGKKKQCMPLTQSFKERLLCKGGHFDQYCKELKEMGMSPPAIKRFRSEIEPLLKYIANGSKAKQKPKPLSNWNLGILLGYTSPALIPKSQKGNSHSEAVYWHPSEVIRTHTSLGVFGIDITKLPHGKRRDVLHHFINISFNFCNSIDCQLALISWMAAQAIEQSAERDTIKVGILHSLTGTMAISERPLVDALLMAIDEINESGGVTGQQIEPIVVDGASDWDTFAEEAESLITQEGVSSIFGGWTSASRKAMKPVVEKYGNLLWYPLQYEGLEESANIMYTGAAPNQQVLPAVDWAFKNIGKTFFLVGSDYVFPRSANEIIKARIAELGGKVVGEEYEVLGGRDFRSIVQKIKRTKPSMILSTINGDSNIAFFRQLRQAGIAPTDIPTMSFSAAEEEIINIGPKNVAGDFAAWNYFQSLSSEKNRKFVKNFQKKYGKNRVTDDPIESAYFSVYLFARAVEQADSDDVIDIRNAAKGLVVYAPEGEVLIDPETQHTYRTPLIGQIRDDGQFDIVWSADEPIKPKPYPTYKSKKEWHAFIDNLYEGWGKHWARD